MRRSRGNWGALGKSACLCSLRFPCLRLWQLSFLKAAKWWQQNSYYAEHGAHSRCSNVNFQFLATDIHGFNRIVFTTLMQSFNAIWLHSNINYAFRVNKHHLQLLCNIPIGKSILNEAPLFTVMNIRIVCTAFRTGDSSPQVNSGWGVGVIGLKDVDSVTVSGVLGHNVNEEREARVGSTKQEEGPTITWDLEEHGPASTTSVKLCFVKFNQVNTGAIFYSILSPSFPFCKLTPKRPL